MGEEKKTVKKEFRCTQFEYSSSGSDSDEEKNKNKNRIYLKFLSKKNFQSTKNLVKAKKKEEKKKKRGKSKIFLSRYVRMILFFQLLIFSVIIDLDAGIIISSYKIFTKDLNISDLQFGSLNSITTIGKIIALLIFMVIINKNHRKFILVTSSLFHGIFFFCYFFNDNYYYIATLKFFTSFCKEFILIYIPVWIDQFGIKKYKTLLLTIVYMVTSYGRIVGAWIGTVIFNNDWKKAFGCCGIIFLILSFGLFIIPQKYFSTKYMIVEHQKKYTGDVVEKLVQTKSNENKIKKEIENIKDIEYLDDGKKNSLEEKETEKDTDINNNKKEKLIYDYKSEEDKKIMENLSTLNKFKITISNKCFIFSSLSRACLFFIFRIIHVFLKQYSFDVLNYNDEIKFFYYYSLTTILAPSLGSLIGGVICNKYLGGYESKNSIWLILFFGTSAIFFISSIRISIDFNYLIIYIFGYFFSVSSFLPTISGYIINSLNKEMKGFGSSFDSLVVNILGKLPSPIIYGILNDKYKKEDPKYAWNKSLIIYYLGIILIYLTCFFKWKLNNKTKDKVKTKNVVERTMTDYTLNRSNLLRAEKPIPKNYNIYDETIPVELENIDDNSSTNKTSKNEY